MYGSGREMRRQKKCVRWEWGRCPCIVYKSLHWQKGHRVPWLPIHLEIQSWVQWEARG